MPTPKKSTNKIPSGQQMINGFLSPMSRFTELNKIVLNTGFEADDDPIVTTPPLLKRKRIIRDDDDDIAVPMQQVNSQPPANGTARVIISDDSDNEVDGATEQSATAAPTQSLQKQSKNTQPEQQVRIHP
jgi:hypothetical protein